MKFILILMFMEKGNKYMKYEYFSDLKVEKT